MPDRRMPQKLSQDCEGLIWARERADLRQVELARAVSISRSYMSEIEKGTRNCPKALLAQIAERLGCPVTFIAAKRSAA